jgi:hypothetical protein
MKPGFVNEQMRSEQDRLKYREECE